MGHPTASMVDRGSDPMPFSLEQEFLRLQHEHDGSQGGFGPRPISSGGWRLTGELDTVVLQETLSEVVSRHEALRTTIVAGADGWQQRVMPPSPPELVVQDIPPSDERSRDEQAEEFLNDIESGTFDMSQMPAFWAFLGRLDEQDAVVVLVAHLPMVDIWSLSLVMRDVVACYAARRGNEKSGRAEVTQYREYVSKQREESNKAAANKSYAYWREKLHGARAIVLPADHPPSSGALSGTRCDRFSVGPSLGSRTLSLARSMRCSPFMVLFAAYRVHLFRLTGAVDGVVWTLTSGPGRRRRWMEDTVGYFVNMFPLKTDLQQCTTFRHVVERVRETCMEAFPHEVPFVRLAQEAPAAIGELEQGGMVVPGFQMSPNPFVSRDQVAGGVSCAAVQRRLSQPVGPDIPDDAILWTAETAPADDLIFAVNSSIDRFDQPTIDAMLADFRAVLRSGSETPDIPLNEIAAEPGD